MVFSSIEFLFFFLPITLLVYFVAPRVLKNAVLLFASLVFYTWGGGALVLLLLVSIFVDYSLGWVVSWSLDTGRMRIKRAAVAASLIVNLGMLSYFKYANFLIDQLNNLGFGTIAWNSVVLPIGISFFTFQSMSYTIDVSRGRCRHLSNPVDFAVFVALFPQLIAGPIVRFHEISEEIRSRRSTLDGVAQGALRFTHGLAKKVIVADAVASIADNAFASNELGFAAAWIGTLAYTIQIYFDFSGYSDMAIGLGKMLGFSFPENFDRPYSAYSITDFWRRWHMTLSNWFRDYLYLPLGGSRTTPRRVYANLLVVFLATGIWHGANWTFIVWGMYHGGIMLIERVSRTRFVDSAPRPSLNRALTIMLVMIGWVMFRAESASHAFTVYAAMINPLGSNAFDTFELGLSHRDLAVLLLASLVFVLPRDFNGGLILENTRLPSFNPIRVAYMGLALPYCTMLLASGSFSPFLYFQF